MATPKKQKNGKWEVLVYIGRDQNGKKKYKHLTASDKKTLQYQMALCKTQGIQKKESHLTVRKAVEEYISLGEVLAPSTLRGYNTILNNRFKSLMEKDISALTDDVMQTAINDECRLTVRGGRPINPKTVCEAYSLVATALKRYNKVFKVRLPKKIKKIKNLAEPQDILKAIKGTDIELPCLLAMWLSLSISEIRGINCSSIKNGVLYIEQVKVYVGYDAVKQTGKVDTRIRNHVLPNYLMSLINNTETYKNYAQTGKDGPLIAFTARQIYGRWKKIASTHGWDMSFHNLRAESASIMLRLNIPTKYAMERGGWKSDNILKSVYQTTFSSGRQAADKQINMFFESIIEPKDNI